jgi:hypothetical protein
MTTLEALNDHTKNLNIVPNLYQTELKKIERDIAEFRAAKLHRQATLLEHSARKEAAKKVGLKPLSPTDACRAMAGTKRGYTQWQFASGIRREEFEWDIRTSMFESMRPIRFFRYPMITYPFISAKHDMLMAPMTALSVPMPKGVLYLTNDLKEIKIFDFFVAIAPISCFKVNPAPVDPVILAVVRGSESEEIDDWQTYFVAMWK